MISFLSIRLDLIPLALLVKSVFPVCVKSVFPVCAGFQSVSQWYGMDDDDARDVHGPWSQQAPVRVQRSTRNPRTSIQQCSCAIPGTSTGVIVPLIPQAHSSGATGSVDTLSRKHLFSATTNGGATSKPVKKKAKPSLPLPTTNPVKPGCKPLRFADGSILIPTPDGKFLLPCVPDGLPKSSASKLKAAMGPHGMVISRDLLFKLQ